MIATRRATVESAGCTSRLEALLTLASSGPAHMTPGSPGDKVRSGGHSPTRATNKTARRQSGREASWSMAYKQRCRDRRVLGFRRWPIDAAEPAGLLAVGASTCQPAREFYGLVLHLLGSHRSFAASHQEFAAEVASAVPPGGWRLIPSGIPQQGREKSESLHGCGAARR